MDPIRQKNLASLEAKGFRVAPNLPRAKRSPGSLRSPEEIAQMAMALLAMFAQVAMREADVPTAALGDWVRRNRLEAVMGRQGQEIFAFSRARAQANFRDAVGWRLENLWPLAWALGFEKTPDVDAKMIDFELLLPALPNPRESIGEVVARSRPRSFEEVDALEDLFYCAHNAVRSAQLGRPTVPPGFHPVANGGVIHERRHALSYLLSPGVAWDDVDLST